MIPGLGAHLPLHLSSQSGNQDLSWRTDLDSIANPLFRSRLHVPRAQDWRPSSNPSPPLPSGCSRPLAPMRMANIVMMEASHGIAVKWLKHWVSRAIAPRAKELLTSRLIIADTASLWSRATFQLETRSSTGDRRKLPLSARCRDEPHSPHPSRVMIGAPVSDSRSIVPRLSSVS